MITAGMLALFVSACPAGWTSASPPLVYDINPKDGKITGENGSFSVSAVMPADGHVWCVANPVPAKQ